MVLLCANAVRFRAQVTFHMHGKPAARNTHCSRTTGEEVHVHSLHRQHGVLQRDFAISETGDPQEQALRTKSSEDQNPCD